MAIVWILYVLLLCVPAFFFAYEGEKGSDCIGFFERCEFTIITLLGFPGAILGSIVRESKEAKRKAEIEAINREQIKRMAEYNSIENQKRRQAALNERIKKYSESHLLPDIIKFLSQHGVPYRIYIQFHCISATRLGGDDTYYFYKHGIQDIPRTEIGGIGTNSSELYALGCAINKAFGNRFTVKETGYDGYVTRVDLERPLDSF